MYLLLGIVMLLKTMNPYFRKHILESLESHEYLFINTFFIAAFVFLFFLYKTIFHDKTFNKIINKLQNLTITQIICFTLIAFITVSSSAVLIHMDKYYNTPLINGLINKTIAAILLMGVGVFLFEEKYTYTQIFGIFLTIVGIYLVLNKRK
jgi:drug/metabolite transporter (DMT)-like permease